MRKIALLVLTLTMFTLQAQETAKAENAPKPKRNISFEYRFDDDLKQTPDSEERLNQWYMDAKFGAFIHFGVYSMLEGEYQGRGAGHRYSEWIQHAAQIPATEYHKVAARFNPSEFDADEWATVFKDAGMRYVVLTSKHHDGFALFDSEVSDYNIVDHTTFKRDIVKELCEACHKVGLKFGVYYSEAQDWDEPDAPMLNKKTNIHDIHPELPENYEQDMDRYIMKKALPQVEELVRNYEIDLIWFDTPAGMTFERAKQFSEVVRKHRPDCLINSRIIHNGKQKILAENLPLFDYVSIGDKEVPTKKLPLYFESPDCVSSSFAYKTKGKVYYHGEKEMMERMIHTVCTGGNYLLNNGPMGNGLLDPEAIRLYGVLGQWMKQNSESIYDTRPNPFDERPQWGDVSVNKLGNIMYLHVLNIPESSELVLSDFSEKIVSVEYLDTELSITYAQNADVTIFYLQDCPKASLDVVIKVTLDRSIYNSNPIK